MTDLPFRPFPDDAAVREIGRRLLDRTLPRAEWTHEAHLGAATWLVRERPDLDLDAQIGSIIARYNVAVGGVNDAVATSPLPAWSTTWLDSTPST